MIVLDNGLVAITDHEKEILINELNVFKEKYHAEYLRLQKLPKVVRRNFEPNRSDSVVYWHYKHVLFQLGYNRLSSFVEKSVYFKSILEKLR